MPEKKTVQRARRAKRQGKAPTTQAGEFVREEIQHIRQGLHGAGSVKQAIAIGLSKARKAGVPVPGRRTRSAAKPASKTVRGRKTASRATISKGATSKRRPARGRPTLKGKARAVARGRRVQARRSTARKSA